jgi:hypothetical protein
MMQFLRILEENFIGSLLLMVRRTLLSESFSLLTQTDPVFFLHHAQIDRLWWLWQQDNPRRLVEYNGYADRNSSKKASINDLLPMLGLAPDLPVSTIISTTSGLLCYRY